MPKQVDVLIIGQGICGTFLSLELERAGLSYLIIDKAKTPNPGKRPGVVTQAGSTLSASRAAAGLINPFTGRRLVTTWMIE